MGGLCLLALAERAEAADARRRFSIPTQPYADALIDLAVQADISLLGAAACGNAGRASLRGTYTLDEALRRLLAGAPCDFRIVDARTVRITPAAASSPPAHQVTAAAPLVAELMVTARKRPERLDSLPAGVSALSGEQLRATGSDDTRDTAGQLVGVTMTNLGPGRDKLVMRGLSDGAFTGRARSTVGTYLDDTPINYNAPNPDLLLVDLERVETLRGPQGALYGSGALAGVYRMVTNKPDASTLAAGITGEYAKTKGGSPSREIEGFFNAPLVQDRVAVRAVAYYDLQGGYLDDVALRLSDVDQTTRAGGRLAARVQVSDAWQIDASAAIQRLRSSDTQYTTAGLRPGLRSNRTREAHDNDFALGSLVINGDLGFAKLASSTGYVRHDFASQYNATAETSDILNIFPVSVNDVGVYSERTRIRRLVQDLILTSTGDGKLHWLAGVYGSISKERTPSSLLVREASGLLNEVYNENRNDKVKDFAVYGEASYSFAEGWTVSAGGRIFRTHLRTMSDIVVAPCTGCQSRTVIGAPTYDGFSPKLSLQYEFANGPLIYGLFSEGYRAGGINSTGFSNIRPVRATFVPDRLRNYEIGAKGRYFEGHLAIRAAAFYDRWTDIQSDQYRQSGLAYTANVGDARIIGLETEIAYDFDFGLSVQANALFAEPKFTRTNSDFALTPLDSGLPGAPRASGGLLARYERELDNAFTLRLIAEASYIGPSRLTFEPSTTTRTGAFVEARLSAEIATQRWSAGVFITNPSDDQGDTFAYGNPFTFGKVRQVTPQRPRTVGVRLGAAF